MFDNSDYFDAARNNQNYYDGMSNEPIIIRSTEEEQQRIAQVWENPRIIAAFKQAQNELTFFDALLDALGIKPNRCDELARQNLDAADQKLLDDFKNSRLDPMLSSKERGSIALLDAQAKHDFLDHVNAAHTPGTASSSSRCV